MSDTQTVTETTPTPRARRPRVAPPAGRATVPATDAADSESPLTLSPDAEAGTRDRALAFAWTDQGHMVRKRSDGVFERIVAPAEPMIPVDDTLEFYPDVSMLDRRVLDPTTDRDVTILFKDETSLKPGQPPKYYKRWVDTTRPHRLLTLTQRKFYRKAEWNMLADKAEIGDRFEGVGTGQGTDPYVRRGDKGQFLLVFMPYAKWMEIKTAEANKRNAKDRALGKPNAEAAAAALGPRAGDMLTAPVDAAGRPAVFGLGQGGIGIREGRPMSMEAFQGSGLPKDISSGEATALEE